MSKRRVVITGMGMISPVGSSVEDAWQAVLKGESGIGPITEFDASDFKTRIAGEVSGFNVDDYLEPKEARKSDPFIHYGIAAGKQAIAAAGLDSASGLDHERVGLAIGSGIGGIATIEDTTETYLERGPRRVSPFFIPGVIVNMIAGQLSIEFGYKGPNIAVVTACTTATHNIGLAARMIENNEADVMLAGGAEYATTPTAIAGFNAARAMSTRNEAPEKASRPWDVDRDGFVLSNGAAVLTLESLEHAQARGANILAELSGFGMSGDAFHITSPPDDGDGARRCMQAALKDADLAPEAVDYINAHGTSTGAGDVAEARAVRQLFGEHADNLLVSSTKSMTGHLLGAAGGIEAVFSILAIRDNVAPPTINLDQQDPECDLDFVANRAREKDIAVSISNSFGFGGTNGSLVFQRFDG